MQTQQLFSMLPIIEKIEIKDESQLAYLSTIVQFESLYYVDVEKDKTLYKNLTIKEWINSILALKEIADDQGFTLIRLDDLFKVLGKYNIPELKNKIVLENFTFKSSSKDLYDTPILKFSNDLILIFPLTMYAPDIISIINSIFSENKLTIEDKGYDFEDYVFNFLEEQMKMIEDFKVSKPKFNNQDGEFQYDAIIEWDKYIFIIECKNRSIPNTTAMSLKDFQEKSNEHIDQVSRLRRGLITYPEEHSIDIKDKIIIPILLNSLPF
ncbi:nuclease-related domain-containing protein, partial [Acinetobacter venetianus]|uniref:nuclease-related domain-containing protein n=1 Tax=Acinetobacter venetianus TaxID=52133 RepID=UPI000B0D40F8